MLNNIPELLDYNLKKFRNKKIIFDNKSSYTYSDLAKRVEMTMDLILNQNLKKNSKICVCMDKSIDQITVILAILSSGNVVVPILPNLKKDNVDHIIKNSDADLIFVDKERYLEISKKFHKKVYKYSYLQIYKKKFKTKDKGLKKIKIFNNSPAFIIYSSGSTGMPKGIIVPHINLIKGARIVSNYLETKKNDKILGILSFNFDYGLNQLWQTLLLGCKLYLYNYTIAYDYYKFIHRHKITVLPLMPVIMTLSTYNQVYKKYIKSVRYICSSGGEIQEITLRKIKKIFPKAKIYLMYGLTEAFRSTYLHPNKTFKKPNSIGSSIPTVKIHILKKNHKECGVGEVGELVHRGGCISLGYYKNKSKTLKVFRRISRFRNEIVVFSGDLVKKDRDGDIFYVGRKDNMIKTAGYRVSPLEVEKQILKFPGISFACVSSVPDEIRGQQIICGYTTSNVKKSIDENKLKSFLFNYLPTYMVPEIFFYFKKFPITGNQGKINRPEIIKEMKDKID
jgi:acyl-coenzyme A synthetase/AMP-(fatty) acid ligase